MTQLGEAFVPIRATLDKLDGDLADARGKIEKALGGVVGGLQKLGTVALAGALAGFAALGAGIGIAMSEAMGAQEVMAQTEAVIASTGSAAGMTAEQIADLAGSLSLQSRFSDDAIQAGENLLLTFTNIGGDTFPRATQAMVDLAAAMKTDVSTGAIQLGKALNDPVGGIASLSRVGIQFTEDQKGLIKSLVETGDVAGAQAVILAELERQFGGSAQAAANTFAGKLDVVKNQLLNVAEGIGLRVLPILSRFIDDVITPAIPVVIDIAEAFGAFIEILAEGDLGGAIDALGEFDSVRAILQGLGIDIYSLSGFVEDVAAILTGLVDVFILGKEPLGDWSTLWEHLSAVVGPNLASSLLEVIATVKSVVDTAVGWLTQNIALQDVLIALGVAIATVVVPAIASVVAAAAPVVLAFVAVIAVAALLRQAWTENWSGIQEKTAAVWANIKPLFDQVKTWLEVNIPIAIEALRSFWVETAWPAIQRTIEVVWPIIRSIFQAVVDFITNVYIPTAARLMDFWVNTAWPAMQRALEVVWPIIQNIFTQIKDFILNTLIPTVVNLYTQWTTVWWPQIETALKNAWTVIETVFKELDRWINTNIVPWIEHLQKVWAEDAWPAIQKALNDAWVIIKPIWEAFQTWLDKTLPVATEGFRDIFAGAMTALSAALQPVKDSWDGFVTAVSDFWSWITSHTFSFNISLPDLPDWAVPGSPLPIHTAWKSFAEEMNRTAVAPRFDLGAMVPAMGIAGADTELDRSVHYSSTTTVNTNRDPMRVLRASRHLDKLGARA